MILEWSTEQRVVNDLLPLEINPRKITEAKRMKMIESIQKFNLVDIPVIDTDGTIISGHQRMRALQAIGRGDELIDVRIPNRKLTTKELKEYNILANQHFGEFDMEVMDIEFKDLDFEDIGVDMKAIEFEQSDMFGKSKVKFEIEKERKAQVIEAKEDDFDTTPPAEPFTVLGDMYEIGEHRLLCGDSTDSDQVAKLMNGKKADMVFTDPPYNVAFNRRAGKFDVIKNDDLSINDFEDLINGFVSILNILNPKCYYVWCNWKFYGILQTKLEFKACIVWAKNVFGLGNGYRHQHEFCLFNGQIDDGINNESDLWNISKDTNYQHPTQKPIALAERALNNHMDAILIVDLFSGSGSTMVASHQLQRKCYGMELDPKYCDVIVKRMHKLDPSLRIIRNGIDITDTIDSL